ncbi:HEAT repeat domain-containing protein [Pseudoalteromonas sp. T1lg23B]|uniref:HEAT repeat domain-containing protein n=1 Tax=Pseudoalteromonas sp. T1lg23B TaxID=2077097 RepID=UPI000CF6296B|nr:HEAT repeat domain-containing protein [Pseudoalteromonas sp. T1lg23B]
MKMIKTLLLLILLNSFSVQGYEGNLKNVHSVLEEFNLQTGTNKVNEQFVFTYAVRASNALSIDWSSGNKKDTSNELLKLWEGQSELNTLDSKGLLKSTRFKIELAGYLGVGIDKCIVTYDKNALRFFVVNYLEDRNARMRIAAIRNLGFVGNNQDIEYLSKVVKKQLEGWSQHAARSLDLIGTKESIGVLIELQNEVTDPALHDFMRSIVSQYSNGVKLAPSCNLNDN